MAFFTGVEHERDGNGIVRLNGVAEHSVREQAKKLSNQIFERGCSLNQSVLMDGVKCADGRCHSYNESVAGKESQDSPAV